MFGQVIREGRASRGGAEGQTGNGGTNLHIAEGELENDPAEEFRPERELAVAVFRQAFIDLGVKMERVRGPRRRAPLVADDCDQRSARLFLFDPQWRDMRQFWLSWLGMTEDDLQALLEKETHQGQENKVRAALRAREPGRPARRAVGTCRTVTAADVDGPCHGLEADVMFLDEVK